MPVLHVVQLSIEDVPAILLDVLKELEPDKLACLFSSCLKNHVALVELAERHEATTPKEPFPYELLDWDLLEHNARLLGSIGYDISEKLAQKMGLKPPPPPAPAPAPPGND